MATTNPTLTAAWGLLVTAGDEFLLTAPTAAGQIEVAVSDTEVSPTVAGHPLTGGAVRESINRALIGPGYVYGRTLGGASIVAVLSAWTPT
jgi:hypothetical protein